MDPVRSNYNRSTCINLQNNIPRSHSRNKERTQSQKNHILIKRLKNLVMLHDRWLGKIPPAIHLVVH